VSPERGSLESGAPVDRRRTVRWSDPATAAAAVQQLNGRDALEALRAGTIPPPPAVLLLGIEIGAIGDGQVEMMLEPAEFHYNTIGTVHGGVLTALLDSVMGCAVHSKLPLGTAYTTLELHINFVRPVTVATGRLRAIGHVLHLGTRSATAEAKLLDARHKLYAHATTTCLIIRQAHGGQ
jgi:uncharacterized protein (TIGR00369 family)